MSAGNVKPLRASKESVNLAGGESSKTESVIDSYPLLNYSITLTSKIP
jgi:hypothetical protein